jgi:hypothetical protein
LKIEKLNPKLKTKLRREVSKKCSGKLYNISKIKVLNESDYFVVNIGLDGDAPKEFIKAYFFEPDSGIKRKNLNTWIPFIAKSAEKWYPHESVIEYMINRIGIELGLKMNEVELVIANGQIRFLSRYFTKSNEALVHGAEICGEYLNDKEFANQIANSYQNSRELFTFEFICQSINAVFPESSKEIIKDLVKMITFDAIVGNNDRHFYNWGVISSVKKIGKISIFAPIYDSARGLFWNEDEENIVKHRKHISQGGAKIEKYIKYAKPRISIEKHANVNHFELISFIKTQNQEYCHIIQDLLTKSKEIRVLKMLENEIFQHFSFERRDLISQVLRKRFDKLRTC